MGLKLEVKTCLSLHQSILWTRRIVQFCLAASSLDPICGICYSTAVLQEDKLSFAYVILFMIKPKHHNHCAMAYLAYFRHAVSPPLRSVQLMTDSSLQVDNSSWWQPDEKKRLKEASGEMDGMKVTWMEDRGARGKPASPVSSSINISCRRLKPALWTLRKCDSWKCSEDGGLQQPSRSKMMGELQHRRVVLGDRKEKTGWVCRWLTDKRDVYGQ